MTGATVKEPALATTAPAARLQGVRKRFGYRDVLRGVSLEIPRGSCFVITGPNGAGKSTLVRILATQWTFTGGEVEVLGWSVRREPARIRSRLGLVFHDTFLRRELTLEENLRFAADLLGLKREVALERIASLLDRFGLAHRRKDAVGTFSQGMIKRAGLARSLIGDPDLWILDEPFSSLDPPGQDLLAQLLREFSGGPRGRTVVLVTHQTSLGRSLATDSVRIVDGEVAKRGARGAAIDGSSPLESSGAGDEAGERP
jgi:ABC-type multidrug transport system ATPase subunit